MGQADISSTLPFRAEDWWKSKASMLMGFVYLYALWFDIPLVVFIPLSIFSILVIVGFASFGYLINDFFDQEKDFIVGKKNFLLGKSVAYQFALLLLTVSFIGLPWLYLPATIYSYILIGIQITLFLIYSVPPVRLKEKGGIGLIVDALYAHAIPVILAAYTFLLASAHTFPAIQLVILFIWQFLCGIRNIILHQSEDRAADSLSKTKNYAASLSEISHHNVMFRGLVIEVIFSVAFFISMSFERAEIILCPILLLVFSIWAIGKFKTNIGAMLNSTWRYFPNNIYEKWFPALFLIILSYYNRYFLFFLIIHLAIFNFDFYTIISRSIYLFLKGVFQNIIIRYTSIIINYSIYYTLLLFGINLKKENTSAFKYFKSRWRRK